MWAQDAEAQPPTPQAGMRGPDTLKCPENPWCVKGTQKTPVTCIGAKDALCLLFLPEAPCPRGEAARLWL